MNIRLFLFLIIGVLISTSTVALPKDTVVVKVLGMAEDARFDPVVVHVNPGDVISFEVVEGLHTVTAYHPDNRRPLRMPNTADSFDSGILKAGDSWTLRIKEKGVYDYFCLPHERLGHAGRIISGDVNFSPNYDDTLLPNAIAQTLEKAAEQLHTQQIEDL